MTWFLRLFPQYRALEDDRLRLNVEAETLREQLSRAQQHQDQAVEDYRKLIDALSLKANGRRIYGENPTPVVTTREALLPNQRRSSRDIQRDKADQFYKKIEELTRQPGTPAPIESIEREDIGAAG